MPLSKTRRAIQIVVFCAFLLLIFLPPALSGKIGITSAPVPRLSPFAAVAAIASGTPPADVARHYWPAVLVIVAAMLAGRVFCGWVCPLGTMIDLGDHLIRLARRPRKQPEPDGGRRLKYYILVALLVLALFGVGVAGWLDPLSLVSRTFTMVVRPWTAWLLDSGLSGLQDRMPSLGEQAQSVRTSLEQTTVISHQRIFAGQGVVLVVFLAVLALGMIMPRCWCRVVCPLGAMLAAVSQWNLLKRKASRNCSGCGACVPACTMGSIADNGKAVLAGECIQCRRCQASCKRNAIVFAAKGRARERTVDLTRRGLLASVAASAAAVPFLKFQQGRGRRSDLVLIRPPGALPEDDFLERCTRCGECMRVCPTNGLQPAALQAGVEGLWSPHLVPRIGHCVRDCTACGQICPSGAIQPLATQQKHSVSIGRATIDRSRCIPWIGWSRQPDASALEAGAFETAGWPEGMKDCNCAVCEEVCPIPTKAIRFSTYRGVGPGGLIEIRRPYVLEDYCTGCGFCERMCPVAGEAAIRVRPQRGTAAVDPDSAGQAGPLAALLPEGVAGFRRTSSPLRYTRQTLTELVDGDAPRYLQRGFVQVMTANYAAADGAAVRMEIWEFGDSQKATEVYRMDAAGLQPLSDIGDEAGIALNMIWGRAGKYYFRTGSSRVGADKVTELVRQIASGIPR